MYNRLRFAAFAVLPAFLLAFAVLFGACMVDENYHLFVHDDDPAGIQVEMSNVVNPSVPVCGGDESIVPSMSVQLVALNEDETTDVSYDRRAKIRLVGEDGSSVALDPSVSPPFEDGEATVPEVTVVGTPNPGVPYVARAEDRDNSDVSGESTQTIELNVRAPDHFNVSYSAPAIIPPGQPSDPFTVYVYPVDVDGDPFPEFDGVVDIAVVNGDADSSWTIDADPLRFPGGAGSASTTVTVEGTGTFDIEATVAQEQPEDVACLGGLEPGDGGGGGDGGDGGGSAQPDDLTCQVYASPTSILTGQNFTITVSVTKTATNDTTYSTFDGTVAVDASRGSIQNADGGLSQSLTAVSSRLEGNFTVPGVNGEIEIGATVSDNESDLNNIACTPATITAETGIGIFGQESGHLVTELGTAMPDVEFKRVPAIGQLSDIEPYTALIVNMAGTNWTAVGQELSVQQAEVVKEYYNSGKPVFIAHDYMSTDVIGAIGSIWNVTGTERLEQSENAPFEFKAGGYTDVVSGADIERFEELKTDGLTPSGLAGTVVEGRESGSVYYPIMVATTSGTKAIVTAEALYHPYESEDAPESQWWEVMPDLVINAITWLTASR